MKYEPFRPGVFYHVYNRGNNKENIFIKVCNYPYFLGLIKKHLSSVVEIYAYCLLPNHFHLILKVKEENELPEKIKLGKQKIHQPFSNLFNAYTKAVNKQNNRSGSLFQEHLKRISIGEERYLKNLILYVNTNSSHHAIEDYRVYRYSSYNSFLSEQLTLLKRDEVLDLFGGIENYIYLHETKNKQLEENQNLMLE